MAFVFDLLSTAKSVYDKVQDIEEKKEDFENTKDLIKNFREAIPDFDAAAYRKYFFISALIVLGLCALVGFLSGGAPELSDNQRLGIAYILFLPLLLISFALPYIFTAFFYLPMLIRMFNARLAMFWGIVTLPWVYLTGCWLMLMLKFHVVGPGSLSPADREAVSDSNIDEKGGFGSEFLSTHDVVSVFNLAEKGVYIPWYAIAFVAVFIFLGAYGRHDGSVWEESHLITRWSRWVAGISAGGLAILSYPLFFRTMDEAPFGAIVLTYDKNESGISKVFSSILQASPIDLQGVLTALLCVALLLIWYAQAE